MFATVQSPLIPQDRSSIPPQAAAAQSPTPLSAHNVNLPPHRASEMSTFKNCQSQYPQTPTTKRHANIYPHTHHHHRQNRHQPQNQQPFSSPILAHPTVTSASSPAPFPPSPSGHPPSSPPQPPSASASSNTYATRYLTTIHNPAGRIASRALSRGTRRDAFLNRIRRVREESAFERRAEQMLGSECVRERRAFLEWMARCAPEIEGELAEKEEGDGDDNGGGGGDEDALEEFLSEEQMFQAYVEWMEQMQQAQGAEGRQNMTDDDDDDYDDLFANLASRDNGGPIHSHDAMDTSHG